MQPGVTCQRGGDHQAKPIIMLCLNTECESRRLVCLTCIDQLHYKHEIISLHKFHKLLEPLRWQNNSSTQTAILKIIQQSEQSMLQTLAKLIDRLTSQIKGYEKRIKDHFDLARSAIQTRDTNALIQNLHADFTNEKICSYLKMINEAKNSGFQDEPSSVQTVVKAEKTFQRGMEAINRIYSQVMEELDKTILRMRSEMSKESHKISKFSKTNKSGFLTVNEDCDNARRTEGSGGYPIVTTADKLSEVNDSVNVKIVEQPGNKGIWMGVCVLDIVKNFNFQSCYGMGKGTWAIDQVGQTHLSAYSWSHHDSNFNQQPKVGFQFSVGDVVNIRVDYAKSTVIFKKKELIYEQPIKTDIGDLYAFVGPTHLGDSISIV